MARKKTTWTIYIGESLHDSAINPIKIKLPYDFVGALLAADEKAWNVLLLEIHKRK